MGGTFYISTVKGVTVTISLSKKITSALLFLSFSTANSLFATDLDLSLQVTGTILAAPAWKDTSASTISSVAFNFGSLIAGQAAANVDSAALSVVLTDPANSGSVLTVAISTPSSYNQ